MSEKFLLRLLQNTTNLANMTILIPNETKGNSTEPSRSGQALEEESSIKMIVLFFSFITLIFCK